WRLLSNRHCLCLPAALAPSSLRSLWWPCRMAPVPLLLFRGVYSFHLRPAELGWHTLRAAGTTRKLVRLLLYSSMKYGLRSLLTFSIRDIALVTVIVALAV